MPAARNRRPDVRCGGLGVRRDGFVADGVDALSNVIRLPEKRRRTHCVGCGIPMTIAWASKADPERCTECAPLHAYREAVEQFVRGTPTDEGPDAA